MAQTAYNFFPPISLAGEFYDSAPHDIVTRTCATLAVGFGTFLVKDAGDGNVLPPSAAASSSSVIEGVVAYSQFIESGLSGDGKTPASPAGKPINCLQRGRIYVVCETAFNPDSDTLFVRFTANGAGKLVGQVRNDNDGGKADELGVNGYNVNYKALNTLTAAGLLALDINLPGQVR